MVRRGITTRQESRRQHPDGPLLILSAGRKDASSPHSTASDPSDQQQSSFHRRQQQQQQHQQERNENDSDVHKNTTAVVEKKIRLAQAQAEIDRILEGPDAPVDLDREMKKVIHVSAPLGPASIVEQELDEKESGMEVELYEAVKQQEFAKAASLKRELNHMHMDDCGSVLQANSLFYRAFSEKNLQGMEALWCKDSTATCIHPSGKPMVGYKTVCDGWRRMFEAQGSFQRAWMEPHNIRIAVKGASMAVISCDEHVYLRRFVRGQRRTTELINKLTATNLFRKIDGRWYMFHHHASWHPDSEVAKLAMRQRKVSPSSSSSRPGSTKGRLVASASTDSDLSIGMDGILGLSDHGPMLGTSSGKKKFGGQAGGKPIKRIVMGDINDILNGQLGDLFGGGESSGASAGSGDDNSDDDATENGAILRFGRMSDDDDEEDEDDDQIEIVNDDDEEVDEDDDDDDEEDEERGSGPQSVSIIKEWARSSSSSKRNRHTSGHKSSSGSSSKVNPVSGAPKDELRQNCIGALRRLSDQGSISHKQKRILLTDIITCSARGEFSMVEVAFELLCGEAGTGSDSDVAEEEFADQCRVFASSLADSTSPFDSPSIHQ